jgi:hypothetical protein
VLSQFKLHHTWGGALQVTHTVSVASPRGGCSASLSCITPWEVLCKLKSVALLLGMLLFCHFQLHDPCGGALRVEIVTAPLKERFSSQRAGVTTPLKRSGRPCCSFAGVAVASSTGCQFFFAGALLLGEQTQRKGGDTHTHGVRAVTIFSTGNNGVGFFLLSINE